MADELERYWFVAAVFRGPRDLAATIAELRSADVSSDRLLVITSRARQEVRKALDGHGPGHVRIVAIRPDGTVQDGDDAVPPPPFALRSILGAMEAGGNSGTDGDHAEGSVRNGHGQIYLQLRQDVAEGALVLIASVASPEEQLHGARILLRGNCECVLTHEIAVRAA